jgi:hypothetical protein
MPCTAYRYHVPQCPKPDAHHVIPQAWQKFLVGGNRLFDPRTVDLCPNCHRGVHARIVALMTNAPTLKRDKLVPIARLALERYVEYGGNLDDLRKAGLWGAQ